MRAAPLSRSARKSTMTTLIAWISIDQNAPSAFYMASDSRISWGSEWARWDAGRKLFACRSYADMFGYAGDVVFPCLVLGQIAEAIDSQLLFHANDISESRHAKFVSAVQASFDRRHNVPDTDFILLHGSRQLTFLRGIHVVDYTEAALKDVAGHVITLAEAENLPAHGEAIRRRFGQ